MVLSQHRKIVTYLFVQIFFFFSFCQIVNSKKNEMPKGQFRRYNVCLRLSHAISRARAARVMQKIAHNSRHSTLPITTIVVGF